MPSSGLLFVVKRFRWIADELIAFGQNDQWEDQILKYLLEYSQQIKKDYTLFLKGFK